VCTIYAVPPEGLPFDLAVTTLVGEAPLFCTMRLNKKAEPWTCFEMILKSDMESTDHMPYHGDLRRAAL
jgi:hypothetical protein